MKREREREKERRDTEEKKEKRIRKGFTIKPNSSTSWEQPGGE